MVDILKIGRHDVVGFGYNNTTETGHADDMQFLPTHWKLDVI
jgi:hypothetical protein